MADLIKMTRLPEEANGGPTEADVHPDEVQNFTLGGWVPAAVPAASKTTLNVAQTVELVVAAQTIEELDTLAQGEERKGVMDAIAKRRAELTKPAE
jgi:predicted 3-demethylubiquinone-9 3-methyltransferase (glyoxalase superfamily)